MKKLLSIFILLLFVFINAQTELVFVFFKDKPNKAVFYANPLSELSQKSLDRRIKYGIALNDQDAPIEPTYIQNVKDLGFSVEDQSKWMNGAAVNATTSQILDLEARAYVQSVERFIKHPTGGKSPVEKINKFDEFKSALAKTTFNYGLGLSQIDQVNLRPLHVAGFTGAGVTIAVIDSGFPTVNTGAVYERIRTNGQIKGGYDFINKSTDIYNPTLNAHGSYCLGVIAGYVENSFVGSAPDADFYLYETEDATKEIPEEQLYWAQAAEEADRKGVDLITTSLGYYDFDDARYNLLYSDMNGTVSFIARSAQIATEKGIFILAAAGNEGLKPWKYIVTPGDNAKVFTVGGVTSTGDSSTFSSFGPNSVGVIKPDGSSRATSTYMGFNDSVVSSNGTSFATPLAAGGIACLLQAVPTKTVNELSNLLRQNASLYPNTDAQKGYGILNFGQTWNSALATRNTGKRSSVQIYPNPVLKTFTIKTDEKIISVDLYDILGRKVKTFTNVTSPNIEQLSSGVYFVKVQTDKHQYIEKLIKE